jgi:hypothetical protein
VQVWAQRRVSATRIAIVFSLETVFAGLAGYLFSGIASARSVWPAAPRSSPAS